MPLPRPSRRLLADAVKDLMERSGASAEECRNALADEISAGSLVIAGEPHSQPGGWRVIASTDWNRARHGHCCDVVNEIHWDLSAVTWRSGNGWVSVIERVAIVTVLFDHWMAQIPRSASRDAHSEQSGDVAPIPNERGPAGHQKAAQSEKVLAEKRQEFIAWMKAGKEEHGTYPPFDTGKVREGLRQWAKRNEVPRQMVERWRIDEDFLNRPGPPNNPAKNPAKNPTKK